jgi:hypothetical protein
MGRGGRDLPLREHHGKPFRSARALDVSNGSHATIQYDAVEKEDCAQCLVLGGGSDVLLGCEIIQKRSDVTRLEVPRVDRIMKPDETFDPSPVRVSGVFAVVESVTVRRKRLSERRR